MIDYKVVEEDYENYEDGKLVELKTPVVIGDDLYKRIVIASGNGFMMGARQTGIFDPDSDDLLAESTTEVATLAQLVDISNNLELKVSMSH